MTHVTNRDPPDRLLDAAGDGFRVPRHDEESEQIDESGALNGTAPAAPAHEAPHGDEAYSGSMGRDELREKTVAGLRWVSIGRVMAEITAVTSMVVLARLVTPAEFGAVAVAIVVNELANGFNGEGFGSPLVQRKILTREHLEGAAFLSIAFGVLMMALTIVLAPLVAAPLFGHRVSFLIQLFSPAFVLTGVDIVPRAMLQRRLEFRVLSAIDLANVVVTAIASVVLAVELRSAEALVLGNLIGSTVTVALYIKYSRFPFPRWRGKQIREVSAFGMPAGISSLAWTAYRNVDYAILGARLAAAQVGFYWRAFNLGEEYQRKISNIALQMAFPILARAESREHRAHLRQRLVQLNAVVIFPFLGMLVAIAPVFVPWLLGPAWRPAVIPAQILAVSGMGTAMNIATGPMVMAAGRPRLGLRFNVVQLIAYGLLVYFLAPSGIVTVCFGVVAFRAVFLAAAYEVMLRPLIGSGLVELITDMAPAALGTAALIAAAAPLASLLVDAHVAPFLILVAATIAGGLAYLIVIRVGFPSVWRDVRLVAGRVLVGGRRRRRLHWRRTPDPVLSTPAER